MQYSAGAFGRSKADANEKYFVDSIQTDVYRSKAALQKNSSPRPELWSNRAFSDPR